MKSVEPQPSLDANEEISALIETLHSTGRRLEELTAGEVDGVADHDGRTFLLRHVQEQLRHNEAARQTTILNALPAHIALLDSQGRIVSVNQAWQRFADAHAPQCTECGVGANYLAACDSAQGDDAATAQQAAVGIRALQNGATSHFTMEYPCHSPTQQRWFLMTASALADELPTGVVVMHLDITERKQTEQKLHESERVSTASRADAAAVRDIAARLQAILDTVVDGVITIDELGTMETFNPAAERVFGYAADEVIGRNIKMLMPEPYHSNHDGYLARYRSTGEAHLIGTGREVTGLRKDGGIFPLDLSISEMTVGGERHYTGVVRDIAMRKAAEQAVVAARIEAERANTAKNTFLANMSHEIRTPMNGVIGMIEVLQQSSLNGPQMEMANIIRDSSFALLDVINDILDFSKIESGKLEIDHIPMRVADVVEKACGILERMALKKNVELTYFTDPAIPAQVMGDPGRLRQILINLANNAIKFSSATPRPGRVSVRALLVESDAEGVRLEFQIADNGIGLDEDSLARIFAPFVQADVSTTRKYGGTGLGLVISRQLAKMMGGDIRVNSAPGVGSLFSVHLPLELPPGQAPDHASDPNAPAVAKVPTAPLSGETVQRRDGRILVAEDNEINQSVILHQLALLGYVADLADDGREALARWHQGNHALLLTDLQMPNMDGYELTAAIRRTEGVDQHLPIVALTANALKSEELRCKAAGMDDYLTKPLLLDQLQAMLEKWLPIPGQGEVIDAIVQHFAVLDRAVLPQQIGNDPALIARFFKDYQRSAQKAADEIRAAIAQGDWKAAGDGAHKLKSSSRAVGALALGEVCQQLERVGKVGHADAVRVLAAEFENALAAVLDAMNH